MSKKNNKNSKTKKINQKNSKKKPQESVNINNEIKHILLKKLIEKIK